jgi:hypothetical protein
MLDSRQYQLGGLANSLQDLMRRGRLEREVALRLATEASEAARSGALTGRTDLPPFDDIARAFTDRVRQLGGNAYAPPADEDGALDYVSLVDSEHDKRRARKRAR